MTKAGGFFNDLGNQLRSIDLFWQPIPNFNLQGKTKVSSICGGILTIALLYVMVLYGLLKL